ncbi:MAG TPA: hypothetical protein VMY87_02950 [Armatimonadota bacterium]|nr:hypothetical protein [Armatimonadota bacterium]
MRHVAPMRPSREARQRLVRYLRSAAEIVTNIARLAEHQYDERLVELTWQVHCEFGGFVRKIAD